eukprot:CAMPEP_0174757144 /NCGR_PEP_ID=MMETSP1094-20130205/107113_1 /TAXON_ID=156173 /ORGANISM="Chrysochromulina brevifilum, Strain UTEX LB 985" /LENGTH=222 /DNA_ID=CAMNT_0015963059 /DNA_START=18 /DNA_END=687 /DNA_ORIENTATION=-
MDLDAPAATRWDHIAKDYKAKMPAIVAYFESYLPKWAVPMIEAVAAHMTDYFDEYGEEMVGAAKALDVKPGLIVLINLIMQVESIGINCSNWNTTGPTHKDDPGCTAVDPTQKWCYCKAARASGATPVPLAMQLGSEYYEIGQRVEDDGPGLCTSIVAQAADGTIVHGRNLDWNLPPPVRELLIDLHYTKGGVPIARGSGAVGFSGVFNGMSSLTSINQSVR